MTQPQNLSQKHAEYPHSELTHEIINCLFTVFREVGFGYQEKYYQRALATEFDERRIAYVQEQYQKLEYKGKPIGRYYVDFVVQETVVVELKVANEAFDTHVNQVLGYLKACNLPIGLLARITKDGVKVKRLAMTMSSASFSE